MRLTFDIPTSIKFWNSYGPDAGEPTELTRLSASMPSVEDMLNACSSIFGSNTEDIGIAIIKKENRTLANKFRYTILDKPFPKGTFCKIGKGVYVFSPEACFALSASRIGLIPSTLFGMELCGFYRMEEQDGVSIKQDSQPLTSTKEIHRYLDSMNNPKCPQLANSSSMMISDNSMSPAETTLFLLLTLKNHYGGYGLSKPILNGKVSMSGSVQKWTGVNELHCDLVWPEHCVGIEYNSVAHHSGLDSFYSDSQRLSMYAMSGYKIFVANDRTLKSTSSMDTLAEAIRKAIHQKKRAARNAIEYPKASESLRLQLLSYMGIRSSYRF